MHQIITGALHFTIAYKKLSCIVFETPLRKELLIFFGEQKNRKSAIKFEVDNCVAVMNIGTSYYRPQQ